MIGSIDRAGLIEILERIDEALEAPQTLCLIGDAAVILLGNPGRQTADIDVWRRASRIAEPLLRRAAIVAGIEYDPREDVPDGVYLQIVNPGIVNLPKQIADQWPDGSESVALWRGRNLQICCPPAQILAAAKSIRASEADLADIAYLIASANISPEDIQQALRHFPDPRDRATGAENVGLISVFVERAIAVKSRGERESES